MLARNMVVRFEDLARYEAEIMRLRRWRAM